MPGEKLSLLIVDDEETISSILKDFFEDMGLDVTTVNTAAGAIAILAGNTFNVAIVDMRLPDMIGNELILKAHSARPEIKFFIHTGSIDYQLPDELREIGLTEHEIIHKPILDMMTLYDKIKSCMN